MRLGTVWTSDGTTVYADMCRHPPERMGPTFAACVECSELATWLALGHEAGSAVGVPLCERHTMEVRRAQGHRLGSSRRSGW